MAGQEATAVEFVQPGHDGKCGADRGEGRAACTQRAGWGTSHVGIGRCKLHGGSTPNHEKHAQTVAAQAVAAKWGVPRDVDPADALVEEVSRSAGLVAFYEQQLRDVPADKLAEHPFMRLYTAERATLHRVGRDIVALGLTERQLKLLERHAAAIAGAFMAVARRLGHDPNDQAVAAILREQLLELDAGRTVDGEVIEDGD